MAKNQPTLRFDHREIAVIFSLFIFVSLLMFTVGILVGKGISQAKYEAMLVNAATNRNETPSASHAANHEGHGAAHGTSVTTPGEADEHTAPAHAEHAEQNSHASVAAVPSHEAPAAHGGGHEAGHAEPEKREALELIPERPKPIANRNSSLLEPPSAKETESLLNNPKIRSLLDDEENEGKTKAGKDKRNVASLPKSGKAVPSKLPPSFPEGKYTVQVGSYPSEKDAESRVEELKKFGFPFSFKTTKEFGNEKEPWYRVWLGYYPDYETARKSGEYLQEREEVKNYLVRKTEAAN